MDQIGQVFGRFGLLIALAGGGLSLVMFAMVGIQYLMAQGDPQAVAKAKNSFMGAVVGSVIVGLAFILPGVISAIVIEPSGGSSLRVQSGEDCDGLLRSQLVVQRGANTPARIDEVIRQIQNQRDACVVDLWSPKVMAAFANNVAMSPAGHCFDVDDGTTETGFDGTDGSDNGRVGNTVVPSGLRVGNVLTGSGDDDGNVRTTSGRDADNNIIVYWDDDADNRPADQAECWLYVSRLQVWDESY